MADGLPNPMPGDSNVGGEPKPAPPKTGFAPPKMGDDPNTGLAPKAGACPKAGWLLSTGCCIGDVLGTVDLKTFTPVGEPLTAAGDVLLAAPPNGEAGVFVAPPNTIPGFGALVSNIDPDEAVPNPVVLPPKIFPLGEVDPKIEFILLPPNIEVFVEVAGVLENTELEVLPNGDDAGLIIGFPKTFADDAGGCTPGNCAFDTGDAIGLLPNAGVMEVTVVVVAAGMPNEIVPAEVLPELIPKLVADILAAVVSPNVGLLREVWKGDTVLLAGIVEELVVTPIDVFVNPLNTDAVVGAAKVDVPKVDVIDGKGTAPKVVVAGSVIVSGTVVASFMTVWPPNIGAAANEIGA